MFKGKKILITGGTGSLGYHLTKRLLKMNVKSIRIFSRDEWKQTQMLEQLNDSRLRFLIGDVRDKERLSRAMEGVDIVVHAAALKHVPIAEYNAFEAIKTNVVGSQNVVESCLEHNIEKAIAIGTDKAASPYNTYGATKLLMEKIFTSAKFLKGEQKTKFLTVRYGNVLGSRGSILPRFIEQIQNKNIITITDPKMTRFNITMNQAIDLIFRALEQGKGGEIFVPKLNAYTVETMKDAICEILKKEPKIKKIPIRPGEKFHETLISEEEANIVFTTKDDYIIQNQGVSNIIPKQEVSFSKANLKSSYNSNTAKLLSTKELKNLIVKEGLLMDK